MSDETHDTTGLFSGLRQTAGSALDLVKNRLDLAAVEWEEERLRLIDLLVRAALAAVLGILTLVAGTATVVVLLWDYSPLLTLLAVTGLYAAGTAIAVIRLRNALRDHPKPFATTRSALQTDAQWLRGKASRE